MTQDSIGKKIKALRTRLGENQAEFAERFNVEQATVSRWENGAPVQRTYRTKVAELANQTEVEFFHDQELDKITKRRIVKVSGVTVMAEIAKGVWSEPEIKKIFDHPAIPSIPSTEFSIDAQYGAFIADNNYAPDFNYGDYAIFIQHAKKHRNIVDNDIIHIKKKQNGLVQDALVRARIVNNQLEFEPIGEPFNKTLPCEGVEMLEIFLGKFTPHTP